MDIPNAFAIFSRVSSLTPVGFLLSNLWICLYATPESPASRS